MMKPAPSIQDKLADALRKAVYELNEIRARDGIPYTHNGYQSSVTEEYFSSVVDDSFAALAEYDRLVAYRNKTQVDVIV